MLMGLQLNQKTLKWEDDLNTKVLIKNSPMTIKQSNCAVHTDPFHLIKKSNN